MMHQCWRRPSQHRLKKMRRSQESENILVRLVENQEVQVVFIGVNDAASIKAL